MKIDQARQQSHHASLLGVLNGASDAYAMKLTAAELFGGTGHAFIANIHEELCPSGPYVWDPAPFFTLARNLGFDITDLGFFDSESSMDERARIEADIRDYLARGVLCGVLNMENQLIYGYDEHAFLLAEPWAPMEITPPRLTFDTWSEFGTELHITFYAIDRCEPSGLLESAVAALEFALEIYEHPQRYTRERYAMGRDAYRNWIAAVEAGQGMHHGAWWNATVWSECRKYAAKYLGLIGERFPDAFAPLARASRAFADVSERMLRAADKELDPVAKVAALTEAMDIEADAVSEFKAIIRLLVS